MRLKICCYAESWYNARNQIKWKLISYQEHWQHKKRWRHRECSPSGWWNCRDLLWQLHESSTPTGPSASDPVPDAHAKELQTPLQAPEPEEHKWKRALFFKARIPVRRSQSVLDTNLGLLLLLQHRNHFFGWLFGHILIVSHPRNFGIWRSRDVGLNLDLFSLLHAETWLHTCMEGDFWFFWKSKKTTTKSWPMSNLSWNCGL